MSVAHVASAGALVPEVDEYVATLLALFEARIDEMAELVLQDMRREVPAFARLDDPAVGAMRQAIRNGTRLYMDIVSAGRRLDDDQRRVIEAIAVQLAEMGLGHDDVNEGMRVAVRRSWLFLVDRALDLPSSPAATAGLGTLLLETLEFLQDVFSALARGYLSQQSRRVTGQVRAQRELVDDLLSGAFDSDDELVARSRQAGHDLAAPHGLVLFAPARGRQESLGLLRQVKTAFLARVTHACDGSVRMTPAPHAVVVVAAPSPVEWERAQADAAAVSLEHEVVALAVDPMDRPTQVHRAYDDASRQVSLAAAATVAGLVRLGDLAVYRVLARAGDGESKALLARTLGPLFRLTENRRQTLLETLEALWVHDGSVVEAAEALAITERALRYRIRRLRELTGLDPDSPADRLQLDLARHALRLYPDHLIPERRGGAIGRGAEPDDDDLDEPA